MIQITTLAIPFVFGSIVFAPELPCAEPSAFTDTTKNVSVSTALPGEISPPLNGPNAGWSRMLRAARTVSTHSMRSSSVER